MSSEEGENGFIRREEWRIGASLQVRDWDRVEAAVRKSLKIMLCKTVRGNFRLCSNQLLKIMKWTSTITSTSHQLQEVTVPSIYEIYRTTLHLS